MDGIKLKVEQIRKKKNARLRSNYKLARSLGFNSYEAMILSHSQEVKIIEMAKEGLKCSK